MSKCDVQRKLSRKCRVTDTRSVRRSEKENWFSGLDLRITTINWEYFKIFQQGTVYEVS